MLVIKLSKKIILSIESRLRDEEVTFKIIGNNSIRFLLASQLQINKCLDSLSESGKSRQ